MATSGKNLSHYDKEQLPDTGGMRIGLVVSEWNEEITEALFKGAYDTLIDCGLADDRILRWNVPGSFELTFGCKRMIERERPDAVIAIGSVIRGETSHFEQPRAVGHQGNGPPRLAHPNSRHHLAQV